MKMKAMKNVSTKKMAKAADYLAKQYGRLVVPEEDGTFRAEIPEFPGCIATGDTAAEALASLECVAESWIEATLARGQAVPEPGWSALRLEIGAGGIFVVEHIAGEPIFEEG